MRVTLTVTEGPHRGASFAFEEHDAFLVGRSPEAQFRLPLRDKALSRVHFLVEVSPPSCRLLDMASTNGVRVNGKPVHAADLRDGDSIRAGATVLAFAVEDRDPTELAGPDPATSVWTEPPAAAAPAPALTPDAPPEFPGYRIERTLGEGGMGVVYLARREADGVALALKVIRPAVAAQPAVMTRFLREASLLRKFDHPGIVRFHDIGFAAGRLFFAMDHVDGPSAADLLDEHGPLPIPAAVGLARQVLRALSYAHERGSVHRDIKPANVLTTRAGGKHRALLADFGLAKLYHESSLSGLSLTGQMGGTLAYMAPEQITHFRDARPPADLYAVGATLYHLLAGRPIFPALGRPEQQVAAVLFRDPDPLQTHRPDIPDALAAIVHRSIAKAPADRFPDAGAMREALSVFVR